MANAIAFYQKQDRAAASEAAKARTHLSRNWGLVLLRGVLALAFGVAVMLWLWPALASLILLFTTYLLADGVVAIACAVRAVGRHERWGWFLFEGIANIVAGVLALVLPGAALVSFVLLMAFWSMASGAMMIGAGLQTGRPNGGMWVALAGLVSVLWGVLLLSRPIEGALVLTLWLAAYAAAFGLVLIIAAFRLRACLARAPG